MVAAVHGDADIVRMLIDNERVNVNLTNDVNSYREFSFLSRHRFDVDALKIDSLQAALTALMSAAFNNHVEAVRLLVTREDTDFQLTDLVSVNFSVNFFHVSQNGS